nr:PREDICTED: ankyrin repeat and BTB/POZ domain-containing protein 2-like [Lepisosteus oculatus]
MSSKSRVPGFLMELPVQRKTPPKTFEDLTLDSGYGGMAGSCRSSVLSLSPGPGDSLWTLPGDGPFRRDLGAGECHNCSGGRPEDLEKVAPKLPPLEHLPWTEEEVGAVMRKCLPSWTVSEGLIRRVSTCLGRTLLRVAREAQRLSLLCGKCTRHEVQTAAKLVLSWSLSESCVAAGVQALSLCSMSAEEPDVRSKSARCGLALSVGRFFRWMVDARVAPRIHEFAAVYLTAAVQALLEELCSRLGRGPGAEGGPQEEEAALEHMLNNDAELWGLFQPYQHLLCGKTAYDTPVLPSYVSVYTRGSLGRPGSTSPLGPTELQSLEHSLLTSTVDSVAELSALVINAMYCLQRLGSCNPGGMFQLHFRQGALSWEPEALHSLFYYTRRRPAEWDSAQAEPRRVQLTSDSPEMALPPLGEWLRVCLAFAEHRHSQTVDSGDVQQAARLLLPGADCEPRPLRVECCLYASKRLEPVVAEQALRWNLAFRMLSCGRTDLVAPAKALLGPDGINTLNDQGLSPLMYACASGDEAMVQVLLDAGASVDLLVPCGIQKARCAHPETRRWTALCFAAAFGHTSIAQLLLDSGADVDGCVGESEGAESPLQLAAAAGHYELVSLLLEHSADPLSGSCKPGGDTSLHGTSSAFALAAAHGHRNVLRRLLTQPTSDILTLEDMLAEGAGGGAQSRRMGRAQRRALQEALFHSVEHGYIDIALELRQQEAVPWTLHTWLQCLRSSFTQHRWDATHSLLGDFSSLREVYSNEMVSEGLPLLIHILQCCQSESTGQLLATILSCCYGPYPVPTVHDSAPAHRPRRGSACLNNKETSDLTFLVEGKPFYAHRDLVSSASPSLQKLVSNTAQPPGQVEIRDMKFHTFQLVMQYIYNGGTEGLHISQQDALEVLHAAHVFRLKALKRHCEMLCSKYIYPAEAVRIYQQAKLCQALELKAFCEGYFLKNLAVLLEVSCFRCLLQGSDSTAADDSLAHDLLQTLTSRMNAIHQPTAKETTV